MSPNSPPSEDTKKSNKKVNLRSPYLKSVWWKDELAEDSISVYCQGG